MRLRLILSFVIIVLVSVAGVVIAARWNTASAVGGFMYAGGMAYLDDLTKSLEAYYSQNGSWQGAESLLVPSGQMGGGRGSSGGMGAMMNQRIRLADQNGIVIYDSSGSTSPMAFTTAERSQAISLHSGLRRVGYLLAENGMGINRSDQNRLVSRLSNAALTGGLAAGAVALALALLLSTRLLRPVQELQRAAGRLAQGDLTQRVTARGSDELASLGKAFNHMADSLQQAEASRKAMTADIAHELRNPLAVQRAHLEAISDGIYPLTPETLEPVLAQNLFLTRLVEDLRTLALADAGQLSLERIPTNLVLLTGAALDRFRAQAGRRGVILDIVSPAEPLPPIQVDPLRVDQILNNLISNALRYTPDGGKISLQVERQPGSVQISVTDTGPGIPAADLAHIFERFYRVDRSRNRQEGGSGLGLAIARQLAQAHGGSLTARNAPPGGAVFTLVIPSQ
jgi:two-component system, OmpR family, sensor histidine kinase BaeS